MKLQELVFNKFEEHIITEDQVFEMARVKPVRSGLPWIIFISSKDYVKQQHWARIKVSNIKGTFSDNDNFVVSISKQPEVLAGKAKMSQSELEDVFDWVILNYDVLIKYWNEEYKDETDMYNSLKKL